MADNKLGLLLNPAKTEFLLLGTPSQLRKFNSFSDLSFNDSAIQVSASTRNLGVIFDSNLSFEKQIDAVCRSAHYHIRDIRRIRRIVPASALVSLANALVSSRLDYCNSLYSGLPNSSLLRLQSVQNSLARRGTRTAKFDHITLVLKQLHWLPIKQQIDFKLGSMIYKVLQSNQPSYLRSLITIQEHQYATRSSDTLTLKVPHTRTILGCRDFSVAGPRFWNSLPVSMRSADSLMIFRSRDSKLIFFPWHSARNRKQPISD